MPDKNIIERAFELAPDCSSSNELRRRLRKEGFENVEGHLGGLGTRRELQKLYNQGAGTHKTGPKKL